MAGEEKEGGREGEAKQGKDGRERTRAGRQGKQRLHDTVLIAMLSLLHAEQPQPRPCRNTQPALP